MVIDTKMGLACRVQISAVVFTFAHIPLRKVYNYICLAPVMGGIKEIRHFSLDWQPVKVKKNSEFTQSLTGKTEKFYDQWSRIARSRWSK